MWGPSKLFPSPRLRAFTFRRARLHCFCVWCVRDPQRLSQLPGRLRSLYRMSRIEEGTASMTRRRIFISLMFALLTGTALTDADSAELVQVGNLRIETKIEGMGNPPVILESGFTGGLFPWGPVQTAVAKQTLVLSYERAGLGS